MEGWSRFHVAYRRGITVVRLTDKALVKEAQIQELNCDLMDLIEAGGHRVVLNFAGVERLASMVVVAVEEARNRCAAADGGALKICGLGPGLGDLFPITGVAEGIGFYADETTALDSPWPEPSGPRALPIEILSALTKAADIPPIQGGVAIGDGRLVSSPVARNGNSSPRSIRPSPGRPRRLSPASGSTFRSEGRKDVRSRSAGSGTRLDATERASYGWDRRWLAKCTPASSAEKVESSFTTWAAPTALS